MLLKTQPPKPEPGPPCFSCRRAEGIVVPAIRVPLKNWPVPAWIHLKGALCRGCASAFSMTKYGAYDGDWYDRICDELRAYQRPAVNPFPGRPDFKWEEFVIHPHYDPVSREECQLKFLKPDVLRIKGMSQKLW